jgi:hypothetical protein
MIKIVKLITGEELIADVTGDGITMTLSKPCALQMMPSPNNPDQHMIGLFPYAAYAENHSIDVDVDKIVWNASPVRELYNQYNSAFGSGIQLV